MGEQPKLIDKGNLDFLSAHVDMCKLMGSDQTEPIGLNIMEPLIATARLALNMLERQKARTDRIAENILFPPGSPKPQGD